MTLELLIILMGALEFIITSFKSETFTWGQLSEITIDTLSGNITTQ